jgi:amidophosphoribosyltransferase
MCGIGAILHKNNDYNINKILYEMLFNLQHRGQDSSGFVIYNKISNKNNIAKEFGLVDSNLNNISNINGNMGIGHVRYQTSGNFNYNEIQPFYEDIFDGISLVHNGNLINIDEMTKFCIENNIIVNTISDSEFLFKIFIYYLKYYIDDLDLSKLDNNIIKNVVNKIYDLCKGSYSIIIMINNFGLISFRDIYGIRPLVYNFENDSISIASETIAFENYNNYNNVKNG